MPQTSDHQVLIAVFASVLTGGALCGLLIAHQYGCSDPALPAGTHPVNSSSISSTEAEGVEQEQDADHEAVSMPLVQTDGAVDVNPDLAIVGARLIEGDAVTEQDMQDEEQDGIQEAAPGQSLKELAFAIAKHNSESEHVIHQGVHCNECGRQPLRGIRFKCANCGDFDLCETCSATTNHLPTHVFFRIKIPIASIRTKPVPVWYPGRPRALPKDLPEDVMERVTTICKDVLVNDRLVPSEDALKAKYHKFACLADEEYTQCVLELKRGIGFSAFKRLMPLPDRDMEIYSHIFRFYDVHDHGLIGFAEYVVGVIIVMKHRDCGLQFLSRIFSCLNVNGATSIGRQELLRTLRASHEFSVASIQVTLYNRTLAENAHEVDRGQDPRAYIKGSGSLGAYFASSQDEEPRFGANMRQHEGKTVDVNDDLVPGGSDSEVKDEDKLATFLSEDNQNLVTQANAVQQSWLSLEDEYRDDLSQGTIGSIWEYCQRTYYLKAQCGGDYFEADGLRFVRSHIDRQDIGGTLYVAPNPVLDNELFNKLRQLPHTRGLFDMVSETIEKRSLEELSEQRDRSLSLRRELGQLLKYDTRSNAHKSQVEAETDSLYNITEEGLNLLVDPIFHERECAARDARVSATVRKALVEELGIALQVLYEEAPHTRVPDFPLIGFPDDWRLYSTILYRLRKNQKDENSWDDVKTAIVEGRMPGLEPFVAERVTMAPGELDLADGTPPEAWLTGSMNAEDHVVIQTLMNLLLAERTARAEATRGHGWDRLNFKEFRDVVDGRGETEEEWLHRREGELKLKEQGREQAPGGVPEMVRAPEEATEHAKQICDWAWRWISIGIL